MHILQAIFYFFAGNSKEENATLKKQLAAAIAEKHAIAKELATAKSELTTAKSELATAKSELATAKSELDMAKADNLARLLTFIFQIIRQFLTYWANR